MPSLAAGAIEPVLVVVGLLGLTALSGCNGMSCDSSAKSSFMISVRDSVTGVSICDATLVASKGTTETPLTCWDGPDCGCGGITEQLGTFQVSIEKAGYQPGAITVVVDEEDECHVITKNASVKLVPK